MTHDGRNIDTDIGRLSGAAAGMYVESPSEAFPLAPAREELPVRRMPTEAAALQTYYDMPVVKPPPWRWHIPAYLYVGGAAGAAAALGAAAELAGGPMRSLARKTHWIAAAGYGASAALLIADLGRPKRFLNMLRVFRPTSPMNAGTWLLTAGGAAHGLIAASDLLGGRPGKLLATAAGVLGLPLCTYTAVLLSNTAMPLWKQTHRRLPLLFAASSAASAASLLELADPSTPAEARTVRRFSAAAKAAEVVAMRRVERKVAESRAGAPLRRGRTGGLWRAAGALGLASLATTLLAGHKRGGRTLAGVLGTAGAIAMRFAVVEGGKESGRDPRATFEEQRRSR